MPEILEEEQGGQGSWAEWSKWEVEYQTSDRVMASQGPVDQWLNIDVSTEWNGKFFAKFKAQEWCLWGLFYKEHPSCCLENRPEEGKGRTVSTVKGCDSNWGNRWWQLTGWLPQGWRWRAVVGLWELQKEGHETDCGLRAVRGLRQIIGFNDWNVASHSLTW